MNEKTMTKRRRALLIAAAAVPLLAVSAAWWGFDRHSRAELERAEEELRATIVPLGLDPADLLAPDGPNDKALELDEIARRMGYSLRIDCDRPPLPTIDADGRGAHRRELGDALQAELVRAGPGVGAAWRARQPGPWKARHAATLDRLVEALLEGELPSWGPVLRCGDVDPRQRGNGWSGMFWLGRLLNERALDALAEDEQAEAELSLRACWRLQESHAGRLDSVFSQWLGSTLVREQAVILRRLERPSPEWTAQLEARAPLAAAVPALLADGLGWPADLLDEPSWSQPAGRPLREDAPAYTRFASAAPVRALGLEPVGRPWLRLAAADQVRRLRLAALEAESARPCAPDPDALRTAMVAGHPRASWAMGSRNMTESFPLLAATTQLQLDLTLAVLRGREEGFRDGAVVKGSCPEWSWVVSTWDDGTVTLTQAETLRYPNFGELARDWSGRAPIIEAPAGN